eukprot:628416-Prymnesium_polylepis.1
MPRDRCRGRGWAGRGRDGCEGRRGLAAQEAWHGANVERIDPDTTLTKTWFPVARHRVPVDVVVRRLHVHAHNRHRVVGREQHATEHRLHVDAAVVPGAVSDYVGPRGDGGVAAHGRRVESERIARPSSSPVAQVADIQLHVGPRAGLEPERSAHVRKSRNTITRLRAELLCSLAFLQLRVARSVSAEIERPRRRQVK